MLEFACRAADLAEGSCQIVQIQGIDIGILNDRGEVHAYRNICPHQGGPACEGMRLPRVRDEFDEGGLHLGQRFDEGEMHIVCPWHGYEFNIRTGRHVTDEAIGLRKYNVVVENGDVFVEL